MRTVLEEQVEKRKRAIQQEFRSESGLLLDVAKQGSGTTNDGNTARRFFEVPVKSRITGLSKDLIHRCSVVLRTLSSGYEINADAFQGYCVETVRLYLSVYPWFYTPASVHKVISCHKFPLLSCRFTSGFPRS